MEVMYLRRRRVYFRRDMGDIRRKMGVCKRKDQYLPRKDFQIHLIFGGRGSIVQKPPAPVDGTRTRALPPLLRRVLPARFPLRAAFLRALARLPSCGLSLRQRSAARARRCRLWSGYQCRGRGDATTGRPHRRATRGVRSLAGRATGRAGPCRPTLAHPASPAFCLPLSPRPHPKHPRAPSRPQTGVERKLVRAHLLAHDRGAGEEGRMKLART